MGRVMGRQFGVFQPSLDHSANIDVGNRLVGKSAGSTRLSIEINKGCLSLFAGSTKTAID
jgi:hypothetical protein